MVESMLIFMLGPLRQITDFYMEYLLVSNSIAIAGYFATGIFEKEKVVNQIKFEVIYK